VNEYLTRFSMVTAAQSPRSHVVIKNVQEEPPYFVLFLLPATALGRLGAHFLQLDGDED